MHHNGLQVFHLPEGNLRQRIIHLFGNNYNERLVPVNEDTSIVKIFGFIGKPEAAKKTRGEQFFFVNRRFIKSAYLNHAVVGAFNELIAKDAFPFYCIFLDVDPSHIDVNVHPTKQEIKFDDERIVYTFVNTAVKGALAKFSITPTLDFNRETAFDKLEAFSTFPNKPVDFPAANNHVQLPVTEKRFSRMNETEILQKENLKHWKKIYEPVSSDETTTVTLPSEITRETENTHVAIEDFTEKQTPPFQLHNRYIVTQIKSGFIIIDQQAAHERVLFEKYRKGLENNNLTTQQQLFPETLHVAASDVVMLKEILPELRGLGFDIQEFGGNSFVVHGIPSDLKNGDEKELIESILEEYKQSASNVKLNMRNQLAVSMARKAATKAGQILTEKEMKNLIDQLFACEVPFVAPNGQLTIITFDLDELTGLFEKGK